MPTLSRNALFLLTVNDEISVIIMHMPHVTRGLYEIYHIQHADANENLAYEERFDEWYRKSSISSAFVFLVVFRCETRICVMRGGEHSAPHLKINNKFNHILRKGPPLAETRGTSQIEWIATNDLLIRAKR